MIPLWIFFFFFFFPSRNIQIEPWEDQQVFYFIQKNREQELYLWIALLTKDIWYGLKATTTHKKQHFDKLSIKTSALL